MYPATPPETRPALGFTLIELLVVIAIIGILSSVVLSELNRARIKGADSAVKSQLAGLRSQAELFYTENGAVYASGTFVTAATACPTTQPSASGSDYGIMGSPTFYKSIEAARNASGGLCSYIAGPNYWAVVVQLKEANTKSWCVDSFGNSEQLLSGSLQSMPPYTQAILNGELSSSGCS